MPIAKPLALCDDEAQTAVIGYINTMTRTSPRYFSPETLPRDAASAGTFRWTPAQRTALTAKIMLTVSMVCGLEALWRGSVARTLVAGLILAIGSGLLVAAKHAEAS